MAGRDETVTYGNAIKAARRAIFTSETPYSVYILCANNPQAAFAFDDLLRMLAGGSLTVHEIRHAHRKVTTERAGSFQVVAVNPECPEQFTALAAPPSHLIWLYEPSIDVKSRILGSTHEQALSVEAAI